MNVSHLVKICQVLIYLSVGVSLIWGHSVHFSSILIARCDMDCLRYGVGLCGHTL